jgi:hypothetical protein
MAEMISHMKNRPLVLAEHVHWIVQSRFAYSASDSLRYGLVLQTLRVICFYRSMQTSIPGVETALGSLFVLLSHVLVIPGFPEGFFADAYFSATFVSFCVEPSLRTFVLSAIRARLASADPPDEEVPPMIVSAIAKALEAFPDEQAVLLCLDVFAMLSAFVSVNITLSISLLVIRRAVPQILSAVVKRAASRRSTPRSRPWIWL